MKALREKPTQTGRPRSWKASSRLRRARLCAAVLPKPRPGSTDRPLGGDAGRLGRPEAGGEEAVDLGDEVVVARRLLHRPGRALHVHEDDGGAGAGHDPGHLRVGAERARVVDDVGAGVERGAGHAGLRRVDRDEDLGPLPQPPEDRKDPPQLLLLRDGQGARPRALAADVEDVRAGAGQREGVLDGPLGVEVGPAVGKGIGGDIDDAHEPGRRAEVIAPASDLQRLRSPLHRPHALSGREGLASGPPRRAPGPRSRRTRQPPAWACRRRSC